MAEKAPRMEWDSGTAYDFFASLWVLHQPEEFGLRPSWAAGVRSRLPDETRRFMADVIPFLGVPVPWIRTVPAPRDSRAVLQALELIDRSAIVTALVVDGCDCDPAMKDTLRRISSEGTWSPKDLDAFLAHAREMRGKAPTEKERERATRWLEWLARPAELGEMLLRGMNDFREAFFREEERRIAPLLDRSLERARERARSLEAADLVEELTQGLRLGQLLKRPRLLFVPCYWCSPRIIYGCMGEDCWFVLYGARPPDASLVPEDEVPASLSLGLTALAESTRLNILRLLRDEPLAQAQIARRLRLRPSTISHHLKALRLAGLITYLESDGSELRYETRTARVKDICAAISEFLKL